jgi:hypothetical protein
VAKEVEVRNAQIVLRRSLQVQARQKEFQEKYDDVKSKFEDRNDSILKELDELRIHLHRKTDQFDRMSQILHDLDLIIARYRIEALKGKSARINKPSALPQTGVSKGDSTRQEQSIRTVCLMYAQEAEQAKQESRRAKEQLRQSVQQFDLDKLEIERQARKGEADLREALAQEKLR